MHNASRAGVNALFFRGDRARSARSLRRELEGCAATLGANYSHPTLIACNWRLQIIPEARNAPKITFRRIYVRSRDF